MIDACPGEARITVQVSGDYTSIHFHSCEQKTIAKLMQRATNLWPDAPPEVKWLADIITEGHPQQDYFSNPHLAGKASPLNADKQT